LPLAPVSNVPLLLSTDLKNGGGGFVVAVGGGESVGLWSKI
jgi:hypothetical protein